MVEIYRAPQKKQKVNSAKKNNFRQKVYRLLRRAKQKTTAFIPRPKKLNFETQDDGEEIILLLRQHPITQLKKLFLIFLLIISPLTLKWFPLIDFLPARFQLIIILFWYLLVFAFIFEVFLGWYFNVYLITDERIVDIDFYSLIYKEISDAEIENIEDVTIVQGGVLATIFNYGSVIIQTAAEKPQFEFSNVPNPALVAQILQILQLEEKQEKLEGRIR